MTIVNEIFPFSPKLLALMVISKPFTVFVALALLLSTAGTLRQIRWDWPVVTLEGSPETPRTTFPLGSQRFP